MIRVNDTWVIIPDGTRQYVCAKDVHKIDPRTGKQVYMSKAYCTKLDSAVLWVVNQMIQKGCIEEDIDVKDLPAMIKKAYEDIREDVAKHIVEHAEDLSSSLSDKAQAFIIDDTQGEPDEDDETPVNTEEEKELEENK